MGGRCSECGVMSECGAFPCEWSDSRESVGVVPFWRFWFVVLGLGCSLSRRVLSAFYNQVPYHLFEKKILKKSCVSPNSIFCMNFTPVAF